MDVGFFLEGGHRVLGCVRINNLKLAAAEPLLLPDSVPRPPPPPPEVCALRLQHHRCFEITYLFSLSLLYLVDVCVVFIHLRFFLCSFFCFAFFFSFFFFCFRAFFYFIFLIFLFGFFFPKSLFFFSELFFFFRPSLPPSLKKVSTPPGMGISPTSRKMAAAAARKPSTFGPASLPSPSANAASGGTTAAAAGGGKRGEPLPLGNPQLQSTWEDNGESHGFRVRGPGYLSGGGKVDAGAPFGKLVRADLYKVQQYVCMIL